MWVFVGGFLILLVIGAVAAFLNYTDSDLEGVLQDPRYQNDATEKLILMLDGVPWSKVEELQRRGFFRIFNRPGRLIVPFPSMTNVSAAEIWRAELPEGYESLYFDRASGWLRGGAKSYLRKRVVRSADYHQALDYVEPKAFEFIIYGFPDRINRADMRRFFLAYAASNRPIFKAFLKSTDGLTHIGGEDKLEASLIRLDRLLSKIYRDREGRLEIIVCSDHGNEFTRCRRVEVERHLRRHGFRVRNSLAAGSDSAGEPDQSGDGMARRDDTVVIPGFGLVGYAALYTTPSSRPRVAEIVADMEEVAVVAYPDGEDVYLRRGKEVAGISYDGERNSFRYDASHGDPLDIATIVGELNRQGKMSDDGYIADPVWFEALKTHPYPDAIFRLYQAVNGLVKNRADILVGFKDGFVYGSKLFGIYDALVPVVAIHGGLGTAQSEAFLMSTAQEVPPFLRAGEVLPRCLPSA